MLIFISLHNSFDKEKGEEPQHPPPITGFSSFCNLITKDNITDITKKVNQNLSPFYNMQFLHKVFMSYQCEK